MSEAVRTYSKPTRNFTLSSGPGPARGRGRFPVFLVLLLIAAGVYAAWIVRDTHSMNEFIPANQRLEIFVTDPLAKRAKLQTSGVWTTLSAAGPFANVSEALGQDFGVPEWVLRNAVGRHCHLSGTDVEELRDILLVTRMSPVGAIVSRFHAFLPHVESDKAGGLRIRRLRSNGMYYAVRGRILLASPSRRSLIHALTMEGSERASAAQVQKAFAESGSEDFSGTLLFTERDGLGAYFHSLGFAVRLESAGGMLQFRGILRDDWEDRFGELLANAEPQPLYVPAEGPVRVSANFGIPVEALWTSFGEALEWPFMSENQWRLWANDTAEDAAGPILTALVGDQGPGTTFTWLGFDLDEMLPVPIVVAAIEADARAAAPRLEQLPPPDSGRHGPYYDAEGRVAGLPTVSGPSLTAAAAVREGALYLSSSHAMAKGYLNRAGAPDMLPHRGNLYLRLQPTVAVEELIRAGTLLAENNLLDDHTPVSFAEVARQWRESAEGVEEISLLIGVTRGTLTGRVELISPETP